MGMGKAGPRDVLAWRKSMENGVLEYHSTYVRARKKTRTYIRGEMYR